MNELGMFAKFWEPGKVKTRLAESIGPNKSSLVYKSFIECLLSRFGRAADRCSLVVWPRERQNEFEGLAESDGWLVEEQSQGDLGSRMAAYFENALARSNKVVLIGSDSPNLPASAICAAFDQLESKRVVLGPSEDGGYYLIGMTSNIDIFSDIQWSTSLVLQQTIGILNRLSVEYSLLPEWYDIDHDSDLARLKREIDNHSEQQLMVLGEKLRMLSL